MLPVGTSNTPIGRQLFLTPNRYRHLTPPYPDWRQVCRTREVVIGAPDLEMFWEDAGRPWFWFVSEMLTERPCQANNCNVLYRRSRNKTTLLVISPMSAVVSIQSLTYSAMTRASTAPCSDCSPSALTGAILHSQAAWGSVAGSAWLCFLNSNHLDQCPASALTSYMTSGLTSAC